MHGDSDFDDAALPDMVSNLLADTYETCFDTSRPQERPQRIAGGFDREGTAPFDVRVLLGVFDRLVVSGATVVVIEHDLDVIANADWIIDMGPGGGESGGRIVATGTPEQVAANPNSITGRYLR